MAFFDNIGKKISLAGEGALNKGKALADVARLNSNVSEEEKKINNSYYQIGKLYIALHPQDYESDFVALVNSIVSSQDRIKALKQQIQEIKGVVKCEQCGAEVPQNIAFCSACGAQMPKKEIELDENHMRCDGCGAIIDKNLRFCTSCGRLIAEPTQTNISADNSTPSASETPDNAKICPSCGAVMNNQLAFCTECGTSLK